MSTGRPPRARPAARTRPLPAARAGPPLGVHVSVAGGVATAFARAAELGCDAIQIFVKNANQWRARPLEEVEAAAFRTAHAAGGGGAVLAHASHPINLAPPPPPGLGPSPPAPAAEPQRCGP